MLNYSEGRASANYHLPQSIITTHGLHSEMNIYGSNFGNRNNENSRFFLLDQKLRFAIHSNFWVDQMLGPPFLTNFLVKYDIIIQDGENTWCLLVYKPWNNHHELTIVKSTINIINHIVISTINHWIQPLMFTNWTRAPTLYHPIIPYRGHPGTMNDSLNDRHVRPRCERYTH